MESRGGGRGQARAQSGRHVSSGEVGAVAHTAGVTGRRAVAGGRAGGSGRANGSGDLGEGRRAAGGQQTDVGERDDVGWGAGGPLTICAWTWADEAHGVCSFHLAGTCARQARPSAAAAPSGVLDTMQQPATSSSSSSSGQRPPAWGVMERRLLRRPAPVSMRQDGPPALAHRRSAQRPRAGPQRAAILLAAPMLPLLHRSPKTSALPRFNSASRARHVCPNCPTAALPRRGASTECSPWPCRRRRQGALSKRRRNDCSLATTTAPHGGAFLRPACLLSSPLTALPRMAWCSPCYCRRARREPAATQPSEHGRGGDYAALVRRHSMPASRDMSWRGGVAWPCQRQASLPLLLPPARGRQSMGREAQDNKPHELPNLAVQGAPVSSPSRRWLCRWLCRAPDSLSARPSRAQRGGGRRGGGRV